MIIRPKEWTLDLKAELDRFEIVLSERGTQNDDFDYHLERFFFISAFIVRKLVESGKLSSSLINKRYLIEQYSLRDNAMNVDDTNYLYHAENYNMNDVSTQEWPAKEFTNIIIHSYTMNVFSGPNQLFGIYITTKSRKSSLYFLRYDTFKSILLDCIEDQK